MNDRRWRSILAGLLVVAWGSPPVPAAAQDAAAKVEIKAAKGEVLQFAVKSHTLREGESWRGKYRSESTAEIGYCLEVTGKKENGALELKVTYDAIKMKREGGGAHWEFDSTRKPTKPAAAETESSESAAEDEAAAALRKILASEITVPVAEGRVGDVTGFPEMRRGGGGRRGGRSAYVAWAFRSGLQRDLNLILSTALLGQSLETGKVYRPPEPKRPRGGGDGRRGGGAGRFQQEVTYEYQGTDEDPAVATFKLGRVSPERPGGPGGRLFQREEKTKGQARVSLKDGFLLALDLQTTAQTKGERDGQGFSMSSKSSVRIERRVARAGAGAEGIKKP